MEIVLEELKKFDDNSVDLLCTDPPYGYGFMGKDWDKVLPDHNKLAFWMSTHVQKRHLWYERIFDPISKSSDLRVLA